MKWARRTSIPTGLALAGTARPARPAPIYAEDFSELVRAPRRLRVKRGKIIVLQ